MKIFYDQEALNEIVAHAAVRDAGFRARQFAEAERVAQIVKASLEPHNKTRHMTRSVQVRERNSVDLEVVVTDPQVAHVEFGHAYRKTPRGPALKWVEGLHIVRNAALKAGGIARFPK